MLESNLQAVNNDVKALVTDAQVLFNAAAALTGEKAEDLRLRAMSMLDAALVRAHEMQANAIVAGKKMATSTDCYVRENPWRAIAVVAGVGLLTGILLGCKKRGQCDFK